MSKNNNTSKAKKISITKHRNIDPHNNNNNREQKHHNNTRFQKTLKSPIFRCKGLSKSEHGELIDNSRVEKSHIVRSTADLAEIKKSFTILSFESFGLHVKIINSMSE